MPSRTLTSNHRYVPDLSLNDPHSTDTYFIQDERDDQISSGSDEFGHASDTADDSLQSDDDDATNYDGPESPYLPADPLNSIIEEVEAPFPEDGVTE